MHDCSVFACVFTTQVRLEWPTDLAINPLDNSLYILDNNIVLQVQKHSRKTHHHYVALKVQKKVSEKSKKRNLSFHLFEIARNVMLVLSESAYLRKA